jgi:hypothetical protein
MGLLKKITKPLSKVLDKIIPNEIKPFLPYAAALAPYMMPPGAGGIFSGMGINNPMLQRALMSGSLNLGSQLAQEGSEGDFSGLSLGLAGLQGALTAPGAAESLRGMQGTYAPPGVGPGQPTLLQGLRDTGLEGLAKGAEFLGKGVDVLGPGGTEPGLNLATLEAAALPVSQATGDLAYADAQRALRDYENEMANQDQLSLIDDDGRRRAIRAAMEAAGHLEEVIVETLGVLGLKQGGIVGLKHGGRISFDEGGFKPFKYTSKIKEMWEEGYDETKGDQPLELLMRIGLTVGSPLIDIVRTISTFSPMNVGRLAAKAIEQGLDLTKTARDIIEEGPKDDLAQRGRISRESGGVASVLPKGKEADYRGGGVIPVGSKERADDVPARLSKNEFVMTADAVRAAGGGSINKGAKRMYNLMHNLEARV